MLAVEEWPIENIRPYPGNPRKISDEAVAKVAAVIADVGWRQPIVVDETGEIIVGHTRRLAALSLGHTRVPVHVAKGLKPEQIRAYRIADNKVGEETEWDMDALRAELQALGDLGADLVLTGFDADSLTELLDPEAPTSPEEFKSFDETIETNCECPKCGYKWSRT